MDEENEVERLIDSSIGPALQKQKDTERCFTFISFNTLSVLKSWTWDN